MNTYALPKTVSLLGKTYTPRWQTSPDMGGSFATVNIGRTFDSDDDAMDYSFDSFGGWLDGGVHVAIDRHGECTLSVKPR